MNYFSIKLPNEFKIKINLNEFPRLKNASKMELNNWQFISGGEVIHWEELDRYFNRRIIGLMGVNL